MKQLITCIAFVLSGRRLKQAIGKEKYMKKELIKFVFL